MKKYFSFAVTLIMALFVATSCSNDESMVASEDAQVANTRAVGYTPKFTVYIETNDINPLNVGEYTLEGTSTPAIDHVVLFASNIHGTKSTVELYHNQNQRHILNNVETLVRPLQAKGIKVLLGILGDHTGVGFTNMTEAQMNSFAQQVADCVNKYGLDGVDFDDEYAECGKISGTPAPSCANYGLLVQKVRALLPNKLITAFYYSDSVYLGFDQASLNAFDYMWPNFGAGWNAPSGFLTDKWASMSIHYTDEYPWQFEIENAADDYNGYGAIMMFNLRDEDGSWMMNYFAPKVWGKTVCHTGVNHPKNY